MCGEDKDELNPNFKGSASTGLGATQILIGAFSIGFGVWGYLLQASYFFIFFPIWAGVLFLVAGSVAVAASTKPSKSMINATLGLSIVSLLAGASQVVLSVFSFLDLRDVQDTDYCEYVNCTNSTHLCTRWFDGYECVLEGDVVTGSSVSLACLAAGCLLIVIALATAIICCACCMKTPTNKVFPTMIGPDGTTIIPVQTRNHSTQANLKPHTIRTKTMALQTENSVLSEMSSIGHANPYQVHPRIQNGGPQMPQIYILPMPGMNGNAGQQYPQGAQPYPYTYPYPTSGPTNQRQRPPDIPWDQAEEIKPLGAGKSYDRPTYTKAPPPHTEYRKMENSQRSNPGIIENKNSDSDGEEIVRVGEKIIHIHRN